MQIIVSFISMLYRKLVLHRKNLDTNRAGDGLEERKKLVDQGGDGREVDIGVGIDADTRSKAVDIGQKGVERTDDGIELGRDIGGQAGDINLVEDARDEVDEVLELASDGVEGALNISHDAAEEILDSGLKLADGALDGAEKASNGGQRTAGGVEET
jgi:hypothetical protein